MDVESVFGYYDDTDMAISLSLQVVHLRLLRVCVLRLSQKGVEDDGARERHQRSVVPRLRSQRLTKRR